MQRFVAGELARRLPSLTCTDCEREAAAAHVGEVWVFLVNRYYFPRCARREGLF